MNDFGVHWDEIDRSKTSTFTWELYQTYETTSTRRRSRPGLDHETQ